MPTAPRSRTVWLCAALLASVVATVAVDRPELSAAEPSASFVPVTCWSENFDGVTVPALPLGWSSVKLTGTTNPWVTSSTTPDTAPNRAATGNPATISDNSLLSPTIMVPPDTAGTLSFRHSYNTETGFDGGVLEISINGGAFADIIGAGGSFTAGAYSATISASLGNPIGTRQGWTGNSGGYITTTVNMPVSATNQNVRLRWRMGTDASTAGAGWSVDTVTFQADPCGAGARAGAFSKLAPEDLATNQPFSTTLTWGPSTGATSYEYCIFTGNEIQCNAGTGNWISTGTSASVTVNNLIPTYQYWWNVRAVNGAGNTYANFSGGSFFSGSFWRFNVQPQPPAAFSRTAPLSGATNRFTSLTLTWDGSLGASSYEYCIDTTDDGACGSGWVSRGANTFVTFTTLSASTTYSWHVRANNSGGTTYADGNAAAFVTFRTAPASRIPIVDLDGDGTGDVLIQDLPTGQWTWEKYQSGGGFIENINSTGNQGAQVYSQTMRFNADTRTDVTRFNLATGDYRIWMNESGAYTPTGTYGTWWTCWQRHVIDIAGDGFSNFFLHDPATGIWFQCVPTGCFQGGWNPGWEVYPVRLNQDAFGDLFLISRQTGRWFLALGTGPNTYGFTYPVTETWWPNWKIYPGDFNGDGRTDLLLHDPATGIYFVAFTTGSGFSYVQGGWSLGWTPIVADLNGDGMDDVFRHDPVTGNWTPGISDGAGGFTKVGFGTWSLGWQIYPTDFDGDGKADFFLYDPQTGVWYQARTNGPGTFAYTSGLWKPGLLISTGAIGR